MRIALCSDEPYPVHETIAKVVRDRGHECIVVGAFGSGPEVPWARVAEEAARQVATGACQEGIFLCWSGTGICMAANKVSGIRAALCFDPGSARAAREWNHANVLCLSNRTLSDDMAKEILAEWFDTKPTGKGAEGVALLDALDVRTRV